jgi:hypothetical protein
MQHFQYEGFHDMSQPALEHFHNVNNENFQNVTNDDDVVEEVPASEVPPSKGKKKGNNKRGNYKYT